jgi:hypothetical protein
MSACADSWKRTPFTAGVPVAYSPDFTVGEVQKLERGLIPGAMEDKWFVFFEAPYLFLHRSWTGEPVYRVELVRTASGARVKEALVSTGNVADAAERAYQALLLDFIVSNLLLGKDKPFPRPPGLKEPAPGVFQHHIAGTGYPEKKSARKAPWWRFWRR